ncbi:MAG: DUF2891 family protein [Propionibacteriaceae bacterium]|nr:DUF2891 family protein [Propionibacteriaceae bacterium]
MTHDWRSAHAEGWARTVVAAVTQTYPWAAQHTVTGPEDTDATPQRLHPAFHGSFDWHSCVHMLWSGLTLLAEASDHLTPGTRDDLVALLDERLTSANLDAEVELLRRRPGFERPYGWAWALQLVAAADASGNPTWAEATQPLGVLLTERFAAWLPTLHAPVRHGVHSNTAFALLLARDAADAVGSPTLIEVVDAHARQWFGADRGYPIAWEPSGHDFLSPGLAEAVLMQRVLPADDFRDWVGAFLPSLADEGDPLLGAPTGVDATDGQAAHLLGLALSRAWHLRELAPVLDRGASDRIADASAAQVAAVASEITDGDFMATHWLVSFALKAALVAG